MLRRRVGRIVVGASREGRMIGLVGREGWWGGEPCATGSGGDRAVAGRAESRRGQML